MGREALDALGLARSGREMRKGGKSGCPEKKNGVLSPPNHGSSGKERCRGLEEDQMRLWEEFQLMEISGTD